MHALNTEAFFAPANEDDKINHNEEVDTGRDDDRCSKVDSGVGSDVDEATGIPVSQPIFAQCNILTISVGCDPTTLPATLCVHSFTISPTH
jgi:hypothetical protein